LYLCLACQYALPEQTMAADTLRQQRTLEAAIAAANYLLAANNDEAMFGRYF